MAYGKSNRRRGHGPQISWGHDLHLFGSRDVIILSYHEIRVGQLHGCPTRPKIRVGLVLHVLHGSGAYGR